MDDWIYVAGRHQDTWINLKAIEFIRMWDGFYSIGMSTEVIEASLADGDEILRRLGLSRSDTKD